MTARFEWTSGPGFHTGTELAATILSGVIGAFALVRYYSGKQLTFLFLGVGFIGAALFDALHTITSSVHFQGLAAGPTSAVTAWGWTSGRLYLAAMVLAGAWVSRRRAEEDVSRYLERSLYLISGLLALAVFALIVALPLPRVYLEATFIGRPWDVLAGVLFFGGFFWHWHLGHGRTDHFGSWLLVSLLIHGGSQLFFMIFTEASYSALFDMAHMLKIGAYLVTLVGLIVSMKSLVTIAETGRRDVERLNTRLTQEVARRAAAEEDLYDQKTQIESVFEHMSEGVLLVDTDRNIVRANAAADAILERRLEGGQAAEILHDVKVYETDQETPVAGEEFVFARGLRGEETHSQSSWITFGDGSEGKYIQASGRPLHDESGAVEGAVVVFRDVTPEMEAREEAAENQAMLKAVVETAQDAIVSMDKDSTILDFNHAAEVLWGYRRDEIVGKKVTLLMPERYRGEHIKGVERYLRTGKTRYLGQVLDLVALDRDGKEVPVELSVAAWNTEEPGFTAIIRDVSERKEAERRLRESEQTYRAMVTEVPDYAIYMMDTEGHIKTWNEGARRITGYDSEEVIGRHYGMFFLPEDRASGKPASLLDDARSGRTEEYGWRMRKDGSHYYARDVCTTITGPDGELLGFTKIEHDQTEELRAKERLRESEERYRLLAENATDLVAIHSNDGVVHYASPAASSIIGYRPESLMGQPIQRHLHPDDKRDFERTLHQVSEDGENTRATFRFISSDKELLWLECIIRWMPAPTPQEEDRLLATYRDVTAQVQDRNALARSNEELQEFAFIASHDLKEPLRKIIAFGERVESQCAQELGPRGMDYIGRMRSAAERMRNLLDDLLAYSRVTTQAQPFSEIDLNQLAEDVVDDLSAQIEETDAQIDLVTLPQIQGDPTQMRQLIQNLVSNALKYHRADESPRVTLKGQQQDTMMELIVEDNGIGFDMRYADRIFRPFQRLHGRTEYSGSGMGLAIVRKIAERHGGTVRAESTPGQGSRFTVQLPLNFVPADPELTRGPDAHA